MQTAVTINQKEAARLKRAAERVVELAGKMMGGNGKPAEVVVVKRRRRRTVAAKPYTGKPRGRKPKPPMTTPETAAPPAAWAPQPAEQN